MTKEFNTLLKKFSIQEHIEQMTELNAELCQIPALSPCVGTVNQVKKPTSESFFIIYESNKFII